ncbi:MAG: LacI family DNA-binding transcriptional regulator [Atopobiaceae bacterium]|nr:LacI family DNA-binding transcriptional regulator [Atopobiaceae bacterium]
MAKRGVSIYDIAQLAGVSTATVSNVLNEKGSYSAKTRDLVLRIAHEQGYVANFAAKSLREASTKTIALLTPDVSNDFFSTLVLRVESLLHESGYTSYICNTGSDAEREERYVRDLVSKQVDGLVYIGGRTHEPPSIAVDLPVVHIDHRGTIDMRRETYVENDIHAMGYDMTQNLIDHGCTRVALASVSATVYHRGDQDQVAGYLRCLEDHGMPLDENLVLKGPHQQSSLVEAAQLVRDCLDAGHAFDGVVALGDRVALGVVNALKERGVAVGRDVRVIGMDDSIYSRVSTPAISTVRRNTAALAERGAQAMLAMLGDDKDVEAHVLVPHEIVERATTLG